MIPELPFRQSTSQPVTDSNLVGERLSSFMPKMKDFSVLGSKLEFASNKAALKINGMTLVALSHTPYRLDRMGCRFPEIWLPLSGHMVASDGESKFHYGDGRAYFCNSEIRDIKTSSVSAVGFRFDMQRLQATHAAMVGAQRISDVPFRSRILQLQANGVNFLALFKNAFLQIDALQGNALALERLALDDTFYRLAIWLFHPELLQDTGATNHLRSHSEIRIAKLCAFLRANLHNSISLTQMEQVSGLSARVLQYAFQKAFAMRPKQWLRKERLHAARAVLEKPHQPIKLTALAYEFCFSSPSVFSRAYQIEFGELPSETLARKRASFII